MRKILLVVAILMLAMPAWAEVQVIVTATDPCTFEVSFDADGEPNRVRAFGLDISVDNGANITSVGSYKTGESVVGGKGYGVFPGSIDINDDTGEVDANGTPDCNGNAYPLPGTQSGIPSPNVTFEMGSLYVGEANAPDTNGLLFKFYTDKDCNITIGGNAARTGSGSGGIGVVMENPGEIPDVNFIVAEGGCYTGPDTTEWDDVGNPDSWCHPKQCHGDATGSDESWLRNPVAVGLEDVLLLLTGYNDDVYVNPATDPWIAADFTHSSESWLRNPVRVGLQDILVLLNYYNDDTDTVPADCQTGSPVVP